MRNRQAAQAALRSVDLETEATAWRGEDILVLRRDGAGTARALPAALSTAGLHATSEPEHRLPPRARRGWRVGAAASGRPEVDRALGTLVTLMPADAGPALPDALEPQFPIDVVYTWVDGDDPAWQRERQRAQSRMAGAALTTADDAGRYASRDELRYSLRSIDYFAPWVNRIHLVTAGQRPPWLGDADPRLHLVDHAEIFGEDGQLPTFNSHAIEAQLHRIPGLAEHFVYFNDDVFLGRAVQPGTFFTPAGHSRFFPSGHRIPEPDESRLPVDVAARNNRAVIEQRFGRTATRKFRHTPHAQRRSTLERIARENADVIAATVAAPFRSSTDVSIPSSLAHYYGLCLGEAVPGQLDYGYVDLSRPEAQLQLVRMLLATAPEALCINEVTARPGHEDDAERMVSHFLEHLYPVPSGFEREPRSPRKDNQPSTDGSIT